MRVMNNIDQFVTIKQHVEKQREALDSTTDLADVLHEFGLADSVQEELWVIPIDAGASVRSIYAVAKGGYHECDLSLPIILSPVFLAATNRFAIAHNHPSGEMVATPADLQLTQRLMLAAEILELEFLDHLIMGPGGKFMSMKGKKLMQRNKNLRVSAEAE